MQEIMKLPGKAAKKFTSLHPMPILGVMSVFIIPSIFITHSTNNLATHNHLKHLTFQFSVSFAIIFGALLLAKLYHEMSRMQTLNKQKGVEFSLPAIFTGALISLGGICVAFAGGFSSGNIISSLDSSIPSQAKEISKQTAALNYYLIIGAVTLLLGYWIIHASLNRASKNASVSKKIDPENVGTLATMKNTSSLWFMPLIILGILGGFALKGATQVTHTQIALYSGIIFAAGLMIAMPKLLHAWREAHEKCQKGFKIPWQLYGTMFLLAATFTCFGGGLISAALYHDPLWGSIMMVIGMGPMLLMSLLSDAASKDDKQNSNIMQFDHDNRNHENDDEIIAESDNEQSPKLYTSQ